MIEFMEELFLQTMHMIEMILGFLIKYSQIAFMYLIFFGSNLCVHAGDAFKKLCEKYPELNELVEKFTTNFKYVENGLVRFFANHRFEPKNSPWISITWMNNDNDTTEDYFDFSSEVYSEQSMNLCYDITMKESMAKAMHGNDGIIIMRYEDKTRCNMIEKYDDKNIYEPSNVKFLAIEYKHPIMVESILIELDRSWFLCGNQLLSNVFVRRYLDYQPASFYFDGNYTITLIDSNMNITKIDQSQYVVIEKDTYRIVENEFDILSVDSVDNQQQESEEEIDELKEVLDELTKKVEDITIEEEQEDLGE